MGKETADFPPSKVTATITGLVVFGSLIIGSNPFFSNMYSKN
jgi:hypothetical protein